jgi:isoquinoline 1-oxidoreductase alpha subunit
MTKLNINGKEHLLNIEPETPLLWALRDNVNLTGTKYGCGIQQCGACTVHVNGRPVRSCGITVGEVEGENITTIEGLSKDSLNPVQMAWVEEQVPQCGYCQSGQIMAAVSLLERNPDPTDQDIDRGMLNLCRCGTYPRIRKAIHRASDLIKELS